ARMAEMRAERERERERHISAMRGFLTHEQQRRFDSHPPEGRKRAGEEPHRGHERGGHGCRPQRGREPRGGEERGGGGRGDERGEQGVPGLRASFWKPFAFFLPPPSSFAARQAGAESDSAYGAFMSERGALAALIPAPPAFRLPAPAPAKGPTYPSEG